MSDIWSGFCAYAYYGNPSFRMFQGGPWRSDPLDPTEDFYNFRKALEGEAEGKAATKKHKNSTFTLDPPLDFERLLAPTCQQVEAQLKSCCGLDLYPYSEIQSYAANIKGAESHSRLVVEDRVISSPLFISSLAGVGLVGWLLRKSMRGSVNRSAYQPLG